jgi:hypothetical protein
MATLGTFTAHSGAGTSTGFTHTPSAAPDAVLVWVVATDAGALGGDYGGEAFGAAVYASAVPSGQVALYRVNAPPSGAQTVTVTHSTGTEFFCSCVSVLGSGAEVVDTFAGVVDGTTPFNVAISVPAGKRAAVFAGKASGSGFLDITETAPLVRVNAGSFGNRINLLSEVEGPVSGAEYTALFSDTVALVAVLLSDVGGPPSGLDGKMFLTDRRILTPEAAILAPLAGIIYRRQKLALEPES